MQTTNAAYRKLQLEIRELDIRTSKLARVSSLLWPIVATLITACLALSTILMSYRQFTQDDRNKRREVLDRAIASATATEQNAIQRKLSGIWALNQFWKDQDSEQTVLSSLAAELTLDDDQSIASCAAAEVIGNALQGPESFVNGRNAERSARISGFLYGRKDGELGIISRINVYLRARPQSGGMPKPRSVQEVGRCTTALDASKEAIRKNWEFLREINLNDTDLSGASLYEADLADSLLNRADLRGADLRCANLAGTQRTDIVFNDQTRLQFVNAGPDSFPDSSNAHVLHLADSDWQRWRHNGFLVNFKDEPILDSKQGRKAPCEP